MPNAEYECIRVERPAEHVALVTLHRPEAANALNRALINELRAAVEAIEADDDVRVFLLTGAPRPDGRPWFSAGADMREGVGDAVPARRIEANDLINRIDDLLKPSIALIGGLCTTGALELVLACDVRIAADDAAISDWHLKNTGAGLGGWGSATRLARLVGTTKAKELLLTGRSVDGREAERIGLVNRSVPGDQLLAAGLEMASAIAGMRPDGVRLTLGFLQSQEGMDKERALRWAETIPGFMGIERTFPNWGEAAMARVARERQARREP